ncbi:DUF2188 domain-containing protein [Microlunatus sp. GCM10028923]|uniref:DUF2188 domain-containing protein n=1 Tax=Microlunatus sp. GCM10028923 TaxID=3273400 RepID=UPI00362122AE
MDRNVVHVVPRSGHWQVEQGETGIATSDTKEKAIQLAREAAGRTKPSQVVVHGEDGRVQDEFTYEDDPFPPRG